MQALYHLAIGVFATIMTLAWLFVPVRVVPTSGLAFASWSLFALTAGGVVRLVPGTGETVPTELRGITWFAAGLALLSLLALVLYWWDVYPPEEDDQTTMRSDYS